MSKDAYWFPHDSNARHDPKMIAMISVYGMEGYGWYWTIIEMLREHEDYSYSLEAKYSYNSIAQEMKTDVMKAVDFVNDCVNEFGLLSIEDNYLSCESLDRRMIPFDEKRERARQAAEKRWSKHKEKKTEKKEKKVKDTPIDKIKSKDVLKDINVFNTLVDQMRQNDQFKNVPTNVLLNERSRALDWLASKGRSYKDYRAFFKNWMRNNLERKEENKSNNGMVF